MNLATELPYLFMLAGLLLGLCILVATIRLLLGSTVPDRVVALDTINTIVVAAMVTFGVAFQQIFYVDIAIVYALLSFITTLYIAKYMEKTEVGQ